MKIVLDTNIFVSALLKDSATRKILLNENYDFILPSYVFSEMNKHKEEFCRRLGCTPSEFDELLSKILRYVSIISKGRYEDQISQAKRLISDKNDVAFLACALHFHCPIWSDDKHFQQQDTIKIISTKAMMKKKL